MGILYFRGIVDGEVVVEPGRNEGSLSIGVGHDDNVELSWLEVLDLRDALTLWLDEAAVALQPVS